MFSFYDIYPKRFGSMVFVSWWCYFRTFDSRFAWHSADASVKTMRCANVKLHGFTHTCKIIPNIIIIVISFIL